MDVRLQETSQQNRFGSALHRNSLGDDMSAISYVQNLLDQNQAAVRAASGLQSSACHLHLSGRASDEEHQQLYFQ